MKKYISQETDEFVLKPFFEKEFLLQKDISYPKLTIITASYNRAQTLERSILSVLNQNYPNIEFIIIDGGSTDGSVEMIRKYEKNLSYWVSEPDMGIADAWNKGIMKSSGDIISMLNADDWYEPDIFNRVTTIFRRNPSVDIVHGNVRYWNGKKSLYVRKPYLKPEMIWKFMPYLFPSCFIKKSLYDQYGVFDTSYKVSMDYELMLRFFTKGKKYFYVGEVMANFELGGLSDVKCTFGLIENKDIVVRYGYSKVQSYINLWRFLARKYLVRAFEKTRLGFVVDALRKLSGHWSYEESRKK